MVRKGILLLAVALAVALAGAARDANASRKLFVGLTEDGLKWRTAETVTVARDLGISAFRITLYWAPGRTDITAADASELSAAVVGAGDARVVLAVYSQPPVLAERTPTDAKSRSEYCTFVRNAVRRFPQINDVVIWNEPNTNYFWKPQFNPDGTSASPAAYEALAAECWAVLHAFRAGINVIGPATSPWGSDKPTGTHSPFTFIRTLGGIYRERGRTHPLFDTIDHHPYSVVSRERPWREHLDASYIGQGDLGRLLQGLRDAFAGTRQRTPDEGIPIWYLEAGFDTTVPESKRAAYTGAQGFRREDDLLPDVSGVSADPPGSVPAADSVAPDQATQIRDAVRLAYCQPHVDAFFNFLLRDEPDLDRYQSGFLWADGSPKGSYAAFKNAVAEVNARAVDCATARGVAPPGRGSAPATAATATATAAPAQAPAAPVAGSAPGATPARKTRLVYTGSAAGVFGFVRLSARLIESASTARLVGRPVMFRVGARRFTARTRATGVAVVETALPLAPGTATVEVAFAGEDGYTPATTRASVTIASSVGTVRGAGVIQRNSRATPSSFRVFARGDGTRASFRFRTPSLVVTAARIEALGVSRDGRAAWISGVATSRRRFVAFVLDNGRGRRDVLRLWVDGRRVGGPGWVTHGELTVASR